MKIHLYFNMEHNVNLYFYHVAKVFPIQNEGKKKSKAHN